MKKKGIALKQLLKAIEHYQEQDFVCSITLGACAEEIFSRIAKKNSNANHVDDDKSFYDTMMEYLERPKLSEREIINKTNKLRNELKHNDDGENSIVNGDYEYYAEQHIINAIKDYKIAFNEDIDNILVSRFLEKIDPVRLS